MRIIGITGGIGSGKSFVAELAANELDLLHVDTDSIARRQLLKGGASYGGVVDAFGSGILKEDGEIDRAMLGNIVFNDEEKLELLNSLTHPNVRATVDAIIESAGDLYNGVLIETAILKEAGYIGFCSDIWYVYASAGDRKERLISERHLTPEKADAVMARQASEEDFRSYATAVIDNGSGTGREELVKRLHEIYGEVPEKDDIE